MKITKIKKKRKALRIHNLKKMMVTTVVVLVEVVLVVVLLVEVLAQKHWLNVEAAVLVEIVAGGSSSVGTGGKVMGTG